MSPLRGLGAIVLGCSSSCVLGLRRGRAVEKKTQCHSPISFEEFVDRYQRDYPDEDEYRKREGLFAKRVAAVNEHNCGGRWHTWRASINNLADWEDEALANLSSHKSLSHDDEASDGAVYSPYTLSSQRWRRKSYPETVSWEFLKSISTPRHQGHCGSCWALTAVTVMDAHAEMRKLPSDLSISQVLACTPNPHKCGGTGGCHGATSGLAFNYIMHAGLVSSQTFPYPFGNISFRRKEPLECPSSMAVNVTDMDLTLRKFVHSDGNEVHRLRSGHHGLGMVGWKRLAENREHQIVRALVEEGPIAVSISTGPDWHIYGGGVFPAENCDPNRVLRHANVLFGYGFDEDFSLRYWHLKNSWGEDWGEHGNMRLERLDDEDKSCGWDDHPEKGSECEGGRSKIWVCGSCGIIHEATMPIFE